MKNNLYTMHEVCQRTGLKYETLKYYCNQGLVPNIIRTDKKERLFPEESVQWVQSLMILRRSGMSIADIRTYTHLVLEEESSLDQRELLLLQQKQTILDQMNHLKTALEDTEVRLDKIRRIKEGEIPYNDLFSHRTIQFPRSSSDNIKESGDLAHPDQMNPDQK